MHEKLHRELNAFSSLGLVIIVVVIIVVSGIAAYLVINNRATTNRVNCTGDAYTFLGQASYSNGTVNSSPDTTVTQTNPASFSTTFSQVGQSGHVITTTINNLPNYQTVATCTYNP